MFIAKSYSIVYMHHIFFIHSPVNGHSGCFHALAIVNNAAVNTGMHVSLWIRVFIIFGYMPRSGNAGWYSNCIFGFIRILPTVLHRGCTYLHSHQQCRRVGFLFSTFSPAFFICRLIWWWLFWPVWGDTSL